MRIGDARIIKINKEFGLKDYFLAFLCTLLLCTACGKKVDNGEEKQVFRMNISTGLSTLDPAYARDQSAIWMCGQLFNGLVELDEELDVRPALADDWTISDSGRTYTFHIRPNVQFHRHELFGSDSTRELTAEDIAYSFTRICDPEFASSGFWIFNGKIQGLEAFREGTANAISGFEVVAPDTLSIHLTKAFPPFLSTLAMAYGYVVPKEIVDHYGKDFRNHPIGTGPFRFKSWDEGTTLTLLKNEAYFEPGLPRLDAVRVRFIRDRLSEFAEFLQGRLDFVNGLDRATKDEVFEPDGSIKAKYADNYQFDTAPQLNTEFIGIMVDDSIAAAHDSPLRDRRVRQALNYAIDREKLVAYLLNGNGTPADAGMMPRGIPGFNADSVNGFTYDPDRSAQLLRDAGFPGGKGLPVLEINSNPSYQAVMEFVQKSFERIGVTAKIRNMDGGTLRDKAKKGEIDLWRASWIADYPEGENYMGLFYTGNIPPNGANRMRYSDSGFDSLFVQALSTTNDSLRQSLYLQMENQMLADAPVILLYYDQILRLIQPDVQGLRTNALNMLFLKEVEKGAGE